MLHCHGLGFACQVLSPSDASTMNGMLELLVGSPRHGRPGLGVPNLVQNRCVEAMATDTLRAIFLMFDTACECS